MLSSNIETEEGFVKLFSKKVNLDEEEAEGDTGSGSEEDVTNIHAPTFINVRHLLRVSAEDLLTERGGNQH